MGVFKEREIFFFAPCGIRNKGRTAVGYWLCEIILICSTSNQAFGPCLESVEYLNVHISRRTEER